MLRRLARHVLSSEGGVSTAAVGTRQASHYLDYRMALSPICMWHLARCKTSPFVDFWLHVHC